MRILLLLCVILTCSLNLHGQQVEISFDLSTKKPSYSVADQVSVQLSVQSSSVDNFLKLYDADPFDKPVILPENELDEELENVMSQYLSGIGISCEEDSDNKINLKVSICALNFILGKGWTATVKIELKVYVRNRELLSKNLSAYDEAGGGQTEFEFAEQAMNNALYKAFESVNWEQFDGSFSRDASHLTDSKEPRKTKELSHSNIYHALIIAIEDYHYMNKLDKPVNDANKLVEILTSSYTFSPENIIFLKNPDREEIIDNLDLLVSKVGEDDNLLIFYAGHGYWDTQRETGYWLPVDAKISSTANWLRNSTMQEYIGDIKSKHTLLIADACFGGGIFKTRKAFEDAPSSIEHIYALNSRKAITSGMLKEVPDKSIFLEYLIKRLEMNEAKYITSLQLFSSFRIAVMNNSDNVPQYGTIQKTGDEGGDFVFIRSGEN